MSNSTLTVSKKAYKFSYTWTFRPSLTIPWQSSDVFSNAENKYLWNLKFSVYYNNIGVYLQQVTDYDVIAAFTFFIKKSNNEMLTMEINHSHKFTKGRQILGEQDAITEEMLKQLEDGILKISVALTIYVVDNDNVMNSGDKNLLRDFKLMAENKTFADVVLKINDFEITVNKFILMARSSVFRQMFAHDTLERREGCVRMSGMDPRTLSLMLEYMNTGYVEEELSKEQFKDLIYAADFYNLTELKEICGARLSSDLGSSDVVDSLLLADLYDVDHLKKAAIDFIVENRKMFVGTTELKDIVEKSTPKLLMELLSRLLMLP